MYYVSIRGEDKRTHMLYVPKERLDEVKEAMAAYKRLKEGLYELAMKELGRWRSKVRKKP